MMQILSDWWSCPVGLLWYDKDKDLKRNILDLLLQRDINYQFHLLNPRKYLQVENLKNSITSLLSLLLSSSINVYNTLTSKPWGAVEFRTYVVGARLAKLNINCTSRGKFIFISHNMFKLIKDCLCRHLLKFGANSNDNLLRTHIIIKKRKRAPGKKKGEFREERVVVRPLQYPTCFHPHHFYSSHPSRSSGAMLKQTS